MTVEGHNSRDFRWNRSQDLVDRPDCHLGDQAGIPVFDLFFRTGQRVDHVAGRDVFVFALYRNHRLPHRKARSQRFVRPDHGTSYRRPDTVWTADNKRPVGALLNLDVVMSTDGVPRGFRTVHPLGWTSG